MEFFQHIHYPALDISFLNNALSINKLVSLCASISAVTPQNDNEAEIYCTWGAFKLRREEIERGVRFALLDCPHAMAWTITYDEASQDIVIHCTTDKMEHDLDFVDSINEFVADWSSGISESLL